jgi:hypothetical protein
MHVLRKFLFFFSLMFFATSVFAESYMMNASYFVRSTPDFGRRDKNKVGVITRGTKFKVLESIRLSGGAEALKIHVTGLSGNAHLQPSEDYWVYKSKSSDFKKLDNAPRETQAGSTDVPCDGCGSVQPSTTNQRDIGEVSSTIIRQENQPGDDEEEEPGTPGTPGSLDEKIRNYSSSSAVSRAIRAAINNKYPRSRGKCYRKVKDALAAGGLIRSWYSGIPARSAREALKARGFINLLDTQPYKSEMNLCSKAPKGAVCVYSSGIPCKGSARQNPDCGHIEIKTGLSGNNAYVSDYSYPTAINETPRAKRYGSRYKLIGVMIKPM